MKHVQWVGSIIQWIDVSSHPILGFLRPFNQLVMSDVLDLLFVSLLEENRSVFLKIFQVFVALFHF